MASKNHFFPSVLLESNERMLESIGECQINIYLFRELGAEKKTYQRYCPTLQVFHKSCLCQFSLSFLGGGRGILGASTSSNRSPIFVSVLFREVQVKVVRFIFLSTYRAEWVGFVENLN